MCLQRRRRPKADPAIVAQLDAVYAELPTVACKGLCQESCGPIVQSRSMAKQELLRMQDWGGERRGRQQRRPLTCPYLTAEDETGRCSIYEVRPLICRLWGMVDHPMMRCPHGCEATEILPQRAGVAAMAIVATVAGVLAPEPNYIRLADMLRDTERTALDRMIPGTGLAARQRVMIERNPDDDAAAPGAASVPDEPEG